jgi:LmbE family N-acetylglucosaminyl deacetylase
MHGGAAAAEPRRSPFYLPEAISMADQPLRLLAFGAHPDDCEFHSGGLAAIYRSLGHVVKLISVTNGEAGHHEQTGPALTARRRQEAAAAAKTIGAAAEVWDYPDGRMQNTLELRYQIIREIRTFKPDLLLTHRNNDYHPDHRVVGDVVRDACYMVTVPSIVPEVPIVRKDPVVAFMPDKFTKPYPLSPDVIVDITNQLDAIVEMIAQHKSQVFEWLPYNRSELADVPLGDAGRKRWLKAKVVERLRRQSDRYRREIAAVYGDAAARQIELVEPYEISEYASPLTAELHRKLFPFVPPPRVGHDGGLTPIG